MKLSAVALLIVSGVALFSAGGGGTAASADGAIDVRTPQQLAAAIGGAKGGERIRLAAGDYGRLAIRDRRFANPVTIEGPAGQARARFEALRVNSSSGLRLARMEIGADQPAADGAYARIQDSQNVVLDQAHVHGSRDGNPGNDFVGVHVAGGSDITVSGSELEELQIGVMIARADRVRVTGNHIHMIRADGVIAAGSVQLEIAGNYITDFRPLPMDHSDAIQLHNTRMDRGTTGVVIKDNVVLQGAGERLQGIWISDGAPHPHRDITIANNLVYINDYYHGIGLSGVENVKVIGNTVVSEPGDKETAWIRVVHARNVHLEKNISDLLFVQQNVEGLTQTDNMFFTQRSSPRCMFAKLGAGAQVVMSDFAVAGLGFQAGPGVHPMLRAQAARPVALADARRRCAGQFKDK